jgi:serine protease Do
MRPMSASRWLRPLCLALVSVAVTRTVAADGPAKLDSATIARVYEAAAPAVVRLEGGTAHSQSGVIVSRDGLVVTMSNLRPKQKLNVHLADGRKVTGEVLGRSQELGFGLVRITDPGPWPAVAIQPRPWAGGGDVGVVLGYPRNGAGAFDTRPTARLANVSAVSATGWAGADCPWDGSAEFGCGLFDLDGKLVGTAAASVGGQPVTFALAAGLEKHRAGLEAGKCLDVERVATREQLEGAKEVRGKRPAADLAREIPDDVRDRAVKASVKVEVAPGNSFSGTLVDEDGIVVTCAHTNQLAGQRLTVVLSDGRKVVGKVLGTNRVSDIGLIQLDGPGPWPGVKTGDSARLGQGQPCLIVGYPAHPEKGQPERSVAVVAAARPALGYDPTMLFTALDYLIQGGMSGGGVFDREGRLVAVHCGGGNPRIEMVRAQWKELLGETGLAPAKGSVTLPASDEVVKRCARVAVSVERDGKRVALGTIVDASGLLVTKSSLIPDPDAACKLADGRTVAGKVVRRWTEHDLALLKLTKVDGLAAVSFSAAGNDSVGTVVWAPTPGGGATTGIVGHGPRKVGPEPAWTAEGLVGSDRGPLFEGKTLRDRWQFPSLKPGDVLASVDRRPTATVDDLRRELKKFAESHPAGDPLRLEVVRSGAKADVVMPLPAGRPAGPQPAWESARRSGFDEVATCDLSVRATDCGGPVFTARGEFVGVCIASTVPADRAEMMPRMDKSVRASVERKLSGAYVVPAGAIKKAHSEWDHSKE